MKKTDSSLVFQTAFPPEACGVDVLYLTKRAGLGCVSGANTATYFGVLLSRPKKRIIIHFFCKNAVIGSVFVLQGTKKALYCQKYTIDHREEPQ